MMDARECLLAVTTLLCIFADGSSRIVDNKQSWTQWSWSCVNDQCVRKVGSAGGNLTQSSPEACKLVCGRYGALWPRPTTPVTISQKVLTFHPSSMGFEVGYASSDVRQYMDGVVAIFRENLQKECHGNCTLESDTTISIQMGVDFDDMTLNWNTDERYALEITSKGNRVNVQIEAATVFGLRHGLETLLQLIASYKIPSNVYSSSRMGLMIVAGAKIRDSPVYPHRGLMLDTARNFIPMAVIKRTIDGMASCKLNVLHWHATDSQSFPFESTRVPQLARFGAYSASQVYRPDEVKELLNYARLRGVRVILEIDAPAHAGAGWQWGAAAGLGNLTVCWQHIPYRERCIQPPCGQLNPANPHLYRLLGDLYRDIADMFPQGEAFHMGGDEVFFPCWNNTKQITDLLESRGMGREISDFIRLWAEYQATALRVYDEAAGASASPRTPPGQTQPPSPIILWSSHLTSPSFIEHYLQKDRYIIQTWVPRDDPLPTMLLELGYKVIYSTKDAWYLDHGFWGITQYHAWREVYDNRLPRVKAVLGGEACMWSEYVDESNLDTRVWPRAAAVAERLWSDPVSSAKAAEGRFAIFRDRLVTKGFRPEALQPQYCFDNEGSCA